MRYAAENCGLREEIRTLRSLDSIRSAGEIDVQSLTALEKTFLQLLEAQRTDDTTEGEDSFILNLYQQFSNPFLYILSLYIFSLSIYCIFCFKKKFCTM